MASPRRIDPETAGINVSAGQPDSRKRGLLGGPLQFEREVVLDGAVSEQRWMAIISDLQATFDEVGRVKRSSTTYEWAGRGGIELNTVTIWQTEGTVRVTIASSIAGRIAVVYALATLPHFFAYALLSARPFTSFDNSLLAIGAFLTILSIRAWSNRFAHRRSLELDRLLEKIHQRLKHEAELLDL